MAQDDLPAPDMFLVDGSPVASSPADRRRRGVGSRFGILLAAVALFAFGVIAGRASYTVEPGAATRAALAPPATGSSSSTAVVTPSSTTMSTWAPTAGASPSESVADDASPTDSDVNQLQWPTTPGSCAQPVPHPFIDSLGPPPSAPEIAVIAGDSAATVDLSEGTVREGLEDVTSLLAEEDTPHFIRQLVTDHVGTVLNVMRCDGRGEPHIVRIAAPGRAAVLPIPGVNVRSGLVRGGDRVWVTVPPDGAYGVNPMTVVAADTTGDSVTLPSGLIPLGATGSTIVGQFRQGGTPIDSYALVDAASGEVLTTFGGDADPATDPESEGSDDALATIALADNGFVLAAPWSCEEVCTLRRYAVPSGEVHRVDLRPGTPIAGFPIAISPDGAAAAYALYRQPPSPAPLSPTAPMGTGTTRLGMADLGTGELRALPGISLGENQPLAVTYSPDGQWLVVAVSEGDATRLLLYAATGEGPYDPGVTIPGATLWPLLEPAR